MRISDWSSDVCSADLLDHFQAELRSVSEDRPAHYQRELVALVIFPFVAVRDGPAHRHAHKDGDAVSVVPRDGRNVQGWSRGYLPRLRPARPGTIARSEEHTSELQSLMRISYAVFCLK